MLLNASALIKLQQELYIKRTSRYGGALGMEFFMPYGIG